MIIEYPLHVVRDDDLQIIQEALFLGRSMAVATLKAHDTFRRALEVVDRVSWNTTVRTNAAALMRKEHK